MNYIKILLLILSFSLFTPLQSKAYNLEPFTLNKKKNKDPRKWIVGIVGWNAIDDNGTYKKLFDIEKSWHYLPYPTRISIQQNKNNYFILESVFSYNKYKAGKYVNGIILKNSFSYFSFDLNWKFNIKKVIDMGIFEPYPLLGIGYTYKDQTKLKSSISGNAGLGFNLWINENLGLNFQSHAKFSPGGKLLPAQNNYLQHSIGFILKYQKGQKYECSFCTKRYQKQLKKEGSKPKKESE